MSRNRTETTPSHALTQTVQLVVPIKIEGVETTEITVRRLKAKEQLEIADMDITDSKKARSMVCRSTGLSPDDVGELDGADYLAVNEVIESFLSARKSK